MRVTNSMMVSNFLSNLNNSMNKLTGLQGQLASNRKYMHISDDPVSVIYSQQSRQKLYGLGIYQTNVDTGKGWLQQTETSVMELNNLVQEAYEQAVDASTDVKGGLERDIMAKYVGQLRDQVLTVLNSTYGDKYLFGGYNTTGYVESGALVTPFGYREEVVTLPDGSEQTKRLLTYNGVDIPFVPVPSDPLDPTSPLTTPPDFFSDMVTLDMGAGMRMEVSMNGVDVMSYQLADGSMTNIYNMLDEMTRALESEALAAQTKATALRTAQDTAIEAEETALGRPLTDDEKAEIELKVSDQIEGGLEELRMQTAYTAERLGQFIKPLQDAQNHTLSLMAEIGGKSNRLELMSSRYEQDELNYTQMKSDAEDADQAELIMRYKMAEAVYKAALATGSYVIQPSLMDFLR